MAVIEALYFAVSVEIHEKLNMCLETIFAPLRPFSPVAAGLTAIRSESVKSQLSYRQ